MNFKKIARNSGIAAVATLAAGSAMAADATTVSALASGVSFTDVGLAILAVAGSLITLHVTSKGAKQVMSFIGK
jgi:hypothetical protein